MAIKDPKKPFDYDLYDRPESRHMVTTTELYEMFAQRGISRSRISAWMADEWSDADPLGFNARKVGQKRTKYGPLGGRWMVEESLAVAFIEDWLESDARSMTVGELGGMLGLSDTKAKKLAESQGFFDPDRESGDPLVMDSLVVGNWLEEVQTQYYAENLGALVDKFTAGEGPLTDQELEIYAWTLGERKDMPMLPASELMEYISRSTVSGSADIAEQFRVSPETAREWLTDPSHPLYDADYLSGQYEIPNTQVVDYIKSLYTEEPSEFEPMDSYRFETTELKSYVKQTYGRDLTPSQLDKYQDEYGGFEEKDLDTGSKEWNTDRLDEFITHLDYLDSAWSSEEIALQEGIKPSAVREFLEEQGIEYSQETEGGRLYIDAESYGEFSSRKGEGEVEGMFGTGQMWHKSDAAKYLGLTPYEMDKEIAEGNIHAFEDEKGFLTQISVDDLREYQDMLAARPVYMSSTEASEQLGITSSKVLDLIAGGELQAEKVGGKWQIDMESYTAYSQSLHEQQPVEGVFGTGYTYSVAKAASFLGVSESKVMGWIEDRELDAWKDGARWQVSVDSLSMMAETLATQPDTMGTKELREKYGLTDSEFKKLVGPGGAWHDPERAQGEPYQVPLSTLTDWEESPEGTEVMIGLGKAQGPVEQVLGSGDVRKIFGWSQSKLDRHVETGMLYREKDESGKWRYFLDERSMFQLPGDWQEKLKGVEEGKPTSGIPADSLPEFILGGIIGAVGEDRPYSSGEVVDYLMKERGYSRKSAEGMITEGYLGLEQTETGMWLQPGASLYESMSQYTADEGPGMVTQPVEFGRVVDGDTITLDSGESVRYLGGADAPELGERGWLEYRKANEAFFEEFGNEISVEWTGMRDEYGRPLAHVTNAAGLSAWDYIEQRMAEGTQDVAQPDYMLDMLFKRLYQATRTGDMELAQNTAQEISASGASPEEFHTRGFAAPGETTGPAAASPKGTAFKELRTINEFIDQGYTYSLINRYKELKSSTNPKDEVERERISGLLSDKGINAEEAVTGKADRSWWDIDFWSVPEETPGMEIYGPQPEDLLKFDQPGKGTGEGLYISDTVNFERWLDASSAGDDFNRKRIEKEWRDADIQDPYQRFTDEQIQLASESESVQGWLAEQQGIDRGTIYDPLDRYWWPPYLPKPSEFDRVQSGDYETVGELKSLGPKIAGAVVGSAVLTLLSKYSGAIYRATKGKIVLGRFSHSETSLLIRSIVGTYFSAKGHVSTYEAGKAKGVEALLEDLGISEAVSGEELSKLRAQIEGGGLISEGTRLVDPVTGEAYDFTASRAPTVSDLVGEGILPTGTFWEQDRMRIESITQNIDAGGYVSQSDVNLIEKYASDPEYSKQWKRSRGTDLSDILGQAQEVMADAPTISGLPDAPAGLSEATPDDLQRLADWQGKPYGAALRFEPTDIADASDYVTYARSKGAVWAKDSPEILDFMSAPGLYEPPDWLKAYIVARREAGVTTEWAEPNRLYAQVQSGEDILSVNKMTGEVFGLPDDIAGFTDEIADIGADLDALPSAWDDAAKVPSIQDIDRAHRLIEGSLDDITGDLVKSLKPSVLDTIGKAAAKGGKKAKAVMGKISDLGGKFLGAEDFILLDEVMDETSLAFGENPSGNIVLTADEENYLRSRGYSERLDEIRLQGPGQFALTPFGMEAPTDSIAGGSISIPGWRGIGREIVEMRMATEMATAGLQEVQQADWTSYLWGGWGLEEEPGGMGSANPLFVPEPEARPEGQGYEVGATVMPEWVSELLVKHPLPPQADIPVTIPGAQEMVVLDFGPESFAFQGPVTPGFDPVPIGAMGADTIQDQLLPTPEYPGISQGIPQVDFSQFGFYQTAEMKWEPDPNTWVEVDVSAGDLYKDWRKGQPTLSIGQHTYSLRQGKLQGLREQVGGMGDPLLGRLWEALQGRYGEGGFTAGQYSSWLGYVTHLRSWRVNFDNE